MNNETFLPILKGIVAKLIGYKGKVPTSTGGTINSKYCYTVWLRHLIYATRSGYKNNNAVVAELGPGDSLGTGLAALLCGCRHYYAFDIVKYWDVKRNVQIFDDLVDLFKKRTAIPNDIEFPKATPKLDHYDFPSDILPESLMQEFLSDERINAIRNDLLHSEDKKDHVFISWSVPWDDESIIEKDSVDLVFSQATLQNIPELDLTYEAMKSWLKPGGMMSHIVDFSSIGMTKSWNGNWTFSKKEWKLITDKTIMPLNRATIGDHLSLLEKYNFQLTKKIPFQAQSSFSRKDLAIEFKDINDEELATKSAFIQAIKR